MRSNERASHAVVIGGSIAGLSTARVLGRHFSRVTLIERDELTDQSEVRSGVPQGRQLHVLLRGGQEILESLFPGLGDELRSLGAVRLRWGRDVRWYHFGGWKRANDCPLETIGVSRLLLESRLRARLRQDPSVRIVDGATVESLLADAARTRATGVTIRKPGGATEQLDADLVVDASGRESKAPAWLADLGLPVPRDHVVNAGLGYATRYYRAPPDAARAWKMLIIHATPPHHDRIGAILPVEGDVWQVVLCGVNEDYPPTDAAGFLAFASTLAGSDVYDAIKNAEPLSSVYGYRRTANRLRRYDELDRSLGRFVALGDAVCAFNPVYAQGMTTAAIGAKLLDECLAKADLDTVAKVFHRRLGRKLLVPWLLATSEDFRYPKTEGRKMNLGIRLMHGYVDRLIRASTVDEAAYAAFLAIMHMTRSPAVLLSPRALLGMLRGAGPDALHAGVDAAERRGVEGEGDHAGIPAVDRG